MHLLATACTPCPTPPLAADVTDGAFCIATASTGTIAWLVGLVPGHRRHEVPAKGPIRLSCPSTLPGPRPDAVIQR